MTELIDGAPRRSNSGAIDPLVDRVVVELRARGGGVNVQVRETGRYMRATIEPPDRPHISNDHASELIGGDHAWHLIEIGVEQREDQQVRG